MINTGPIPVIFDHDGGIDDLLSLMLLLTMDNIELKAITVTPADCLPSDAIKSTLKLLTGFARDDIPVARGQLFGANPFPYEWRAQPKVVNALPMMLQLPEANCLTPLTADELITQTLAESDQPVMVLMTGPCTNLVNALQQTPDLVHKVDRVIWMGGAVDTRGNVSMHNHDGSAEWNAYWDPASTAQLFSINPDIELIALDATDSVPVDMAFLERLARQPQSLSQLAGQFWAITTNSIPAYEYTYYMWDMLATAWLGIGENSIQFKELELSVAIDEPNAGQTFRTPGNSQWIKVAKTVDTTRFHHYVLEQFNRPIPFFS